jgi:hypothetical protein
MPRQDSLYDQMASVLDKANEIGAYDAADWIKRVFFKDFEVSLCKDGCFCATKTIDGKCGKCGVKKP